MPGNDIRPNDEYIAKSTGFVDLDGLNVMLRRGSLIVVASRPSAGKSAFVTQCLMNVATSSKYKCTYISLEINATDLSIRMVCSHARVYFGKMRSGRLSEQEWARLIKSSGALSEASIKIIDSDVWSLLEVEGAIRRDFKERGSRIFVVDNIHLISDKGHQNKYEEVSNIIKSMKRTARELDVAVIITSSVNRRPEKRTDKRPKMSDLRDSGHLEQDADVVLSIYRDDMHHVESEDKGVAEICVLKNRFGFKGTVRLKFFESFGRFEECPSSYI